jgi:hypothetical protein
VCMRKNVCMCIIHVLMCDMCLIHVLREMSVSVYVYVCIRVSV